MLTAYGVYELDEPDTHCMLARNTILPINKLLAIKRSFSATTGDPSMFQCISGESNHVLDKKQTSFVLQFERSGKSKAADDGEERF